MKIALATPISLAQGIIYVIIAVVIFSIIICLLRWLRTFLPHPEEIKLGTEDIHLPIDIGIDGFQVSDFVYYTAVGKTIDSCHRYLRSRDVEMLYKMHVDYLLAHKNYPDQWGKPYLGHITKLLFIGVLMNLDDGNFHIHFLSWDHEASCLKRGTIPIEYKLQPGDLIVAARSRN